MVAKILAALLASASAHFAPLVDGARPPVHSSGYDDYTATAAARRLCSSCRIEIERITASGRVVWAARVALPNATGSVSASLAALRALAVPAIPASFHFTGRSVECDGGTQTLTWTGPHARIDVTASVDPESSANAVTREILVTAR